MGRGEVQYHGPAVKLGRHHPIVSVEAFLKWAAYDCTKEMPEKGAWATWPLSANQKQACKSALARTTA
jgi:hypothetical protein